MMVTQVEDKFIQQHELTRKSVQELEKVKESLKNTQIEIEAKNREILDINKKYNNLRVAKISGDYA